jgi:hypothetical protein
VLRHVDLVSDLADGAERVRRFFQRPAPKDAASKRNALEIDFDEMQTKPDTWLRRRER